MNDTFPQILADCLDAIDQGEMTPEECLAKYPQFHQELAVYLEIANQYRSAPPVPMRAEFRQKAQAHLLVQLQDRHPITFNDRIRQIWQILNRNVLRRSTVMVSLFIMILYTLLGSGIVFASDGARPGDVLYNIDQMIEVIRLNLADPQEIARLQLDFASERLQEAEQLSIEGDQINVMRALDHYNEAILNVARAVENIGSAEQAALGDLLDQALSKHEEQLARITRNISKAEQGVVQVEVPDNEDGNEDADYCVGADPHPHAQDLAMAYEDDIDEGENGYDLIMGWFCEGKFGFGEIEHALWTSSEVNEIFPPDDETNGVTDFVEKVELLLGMRATQGWGEIWQWLDLIGDEGDPEEDGGDDQDYCTGADQHPHAQDLADSYEGVDYAQIMEWFCDRNFGFGEIMHALDTSEITGVAPEELLDMKKELGGWGKVWQELGLIGKPPDSGKPEDAGKPDDAGKPEDVGPNKDTGKPDKPDKSKDK